MTFGLAFFSVFLLFVSACFHLPSLSLAPPLSHSASYAHSHLFPVTFSLRFLQFPNCHSPFYSVHANMQYFLSCSFLFSFSYICFRANIMFCFFFPSLIKHKYTYFIYLFLAFYVCIFGPVFCPTVTT